MNPPWGNYQTGSLKVWKDFETRTLKKTDSDYVEGLSYVISGGVALIGGFVAQTISTDPLEKGVYTVFQTIGIASIGYGAYLWKIGDEERTVYESLKATTSLDDNGRGQFVDSYFKNKTQREKNIRTIRAVTHGLVAALNIYSATRQSNETLKNGLYFIGGVNLLACASFSF